MLYIYIYNALLIQHVQCPSSCDVKVNIVPEKQKCLDLCSAILYFSHYVLTQFRKCYINLILHMDFLKWIFLHQKKKKAVAKTCFPNQQARDITRPQYSHVNIENKVSEYLLDGSLKQSLQKYLCSCGYGLGLLFFFLQ